jgi:hypothetical protein
MTIVDFRIRIIRDDDGRFSFQVYNKTNGIVVWSPPDWWEYREAAEEVGERFRLELFKDIKKSGAKALKNSLGEEVFVDEPNPATTIIAALAVHKQTGKYGFVVLTNKNDILVKPTKYFDTPEEAYLFAQESQARIIKELKEKGLGKYVVLPLDRADFVPPELPPDAPVPAPVEVKPKKVMFPYPEHFNPMMN